jgi:hypothetical protein
VNLLSLWQLAEQYCDEKGNQDRDGTGINSSYDAHTLYWNKKQFLKTFHTADSGLLECLFTSGYSRLLAFTSLLVKYYNDTIHWAFSSKVKDYSLASLNNEVVIVTMDSEGGMSFNIPATINNVVSFMGGMKL